MTDRRNIYVGRDRLWERFVAALGDKSASQSIREHMARVVARSERAAK